MTSPYLQNIRSPEELDALIEGHLERAVTNEKEFIEKDVPEMIGNINRVCMEAVAGIEEKTSQIVAKISSWVATATAEIFNDTEAARLKIANIVEDPSDPRSSEIATCMISEVSNRSINLVSRCAETSISKIRSEASQCIQDLRKKAADAFKDFRALAANMTVKIRESVINAAKSFEAAKKASNGQQLLEQVKKETEQAVIDAESASGELEKAKARTLNQINEAIDVANRRIEQAYADAIREIQHAKEKTVLKLNLTAEAALALYP